MKKITLLFALGLLLSSLAYSQEDVYWRGDAGTNLWWDGAVKPWYRTCDGWWLERVDYNVCNNNSTIGGNFIHFDNNNQTSMTVNGAWFKANTLTFESSATTARTLTSDGSGGISFTSATSWLTNKSNAVHTLATGIGIDGASLGINALNGGFNLSKEIYINGNALTFSGGNNITASGTISGSGTLSKQDAGVLTLSGGNSYSGLTTISGGTLKLNRSGGTTIPVTNNVTVTAGTLQISSNQTLANLDLSGGGNLTIDNGVTLIITGVYTGGTGTINNQGTIKLQGGSSQTFPGSSAVINNGTANSMTNLIIDNSTGVILNKSFIITSDLTVNTSKILSLGAAIQLTVSSTMTNNGTLNLLSDASGTATILTPLTITGSGAVSIQQYLSSARNWYISSPIDGATAPSGYTYYQYYEPGTTSGTAWVTPSGSTLTAGRGYIAQLGTGTSTFTVSGSSFSNVDKTLSLSRTTSSYSTGFNLVGNPYPSFLNINDLKDNLDIVATYWIRTKNVNYGFDTYNIPGGMSTNKSGMPVTSYIPPMQAFWLRVASGKSSASVVLKNSNRSHQDVSGNKFRAPSVQNATQQVLRLQVSNGTDSDEAVLYSNPNASNEYDSYDSDKMFINSAVIPEIYTLSGTEKLVINGMTSIPLNQEIPLGLVTLKKGVNSYTIGTSERTNFGSDLKIVLKDNLNPDNVIQTDLSSGSTYTFTSDSVTTESRFSLLFTTIVTDLSTDAMNQSVAVYKDASNRILVKCNPDLSNANLITVYSALGQKLVSKPVSGTTTVIDKPLGSGVYMVTVTINGKNITKKIILD